MDFQFSALALTALSFCCACGGNAAAPAPKAPDTESSSQAAVEKEPSPEDVAAEAKKKADEEAARRVPTQCAEGVGDGKLCLPPPAFAKRLCQGFHPDVALTLLGKGTPFSRGYVAGDIEAWNASGGMSSNDKLAFDEEVLILMHRSADTGGMMVSGASGGYDVLRWDGTCASLSGGELRMKVQVKPKFPPVPWKSLDEKTRTALEADEKVGKAVGDRRRECKGATMGSVSQKCEKADKVMSQVIVEYVRGGGALPELGLLPP
ncbi:hypothetical protein [Chondromyces crocatus]|uniref:Lipoprotein n=1 Tax=Chondromyces crocatus TaxID=52 RepID=A0A0K1ECH8_CHOCO|nr:hypothetical protein [Chondromyces crocatus]AKT38283.1 uncharacterized protein CMC5_024280 [Chondromyces crocatus]